MVTFIISRIPIWHIGWLVAVAFVDAWAVIVVVGWRDEHEEAIPAATVASVDRAHLLERVAVVGAAAHGGA